MSCERVQRPAWTGSHWWMEEKDLAGEETLVEAVGVLRCLKMLGEILALTGEILDCFYGLFLSHLPPRWWMLKVRAASDWAGNWLPPSHQLNRWCFQDRLFCQNWLVLSPFSRLRLSFLRRTLLVCPQSWTVCWTWLRNHAGTIHSLYKGCLFEHTGCCYSLQETLSIHTLGPNIQLDIQENFIIPNVKHRISKPLSLQSLVYVCHYLAEGFTPALI